MQLRLLSALCLCVVGQSAFATSIVFSPAAPTSADIITATFTQAYGGCNARGPALTDTNSDSLTFETELLLGVFNCPVIPFPPPTTTTSTMQIGPLAAGDYTAAWGIYQEEPMPTPRQLVGYASATLHVAPAANAPSAATGADPTPALSTWALLATGGLCALAGLRRLRGSA